MIRVVLYLILVGALSFAAVWFADRPGDVLITWQDFRIETSVMVLVSAFAAVAVLAVLIWTVFRTIMTAPKKVGEYVRNQRGARGYQAVSHGLIAVGAGNAIAAQKYTDEAKRIAPNEPLTLLLSAQTAQLTGNRAAAEQTFQSMARREDTRLLALHGLFVEAQRRDDAAAARRYAEAAAKSTSVPAWAGLAVLEFRCVAGDWTGALERLDLNMKGGLVDQFTYRRQRAVLLTAQAIAALDHDADLARVLAIDAVKFAPTLVPAAAIAGRLLGEAGDLRRAGRIVETAWRANPHPDLAETYAHLAAGASARDRLTRVQALAQSAPDHIEGALAVAHAALDAREFGIARNVLSPLAVSPTQRVAMLMAELEELEHADEGRARAWMTRAVRARRDPAWTADGFVSDRWMPVSPVTGRLDAFQWRTPLAEIEPEGAVIENKERVLIAAPEPANMTAPRSRTARVLPPQPAESKTVVSMPESAPAPSIAARLRPNGRQPEAGTGPAGTGPALTSGTLAGTSSYDRVIPLIPIPDDPGPQADVEGEVEPVPESVPDSWNRLRGLFKG